MLTFEFSNNHNGKLFNNIFGDIRLKGEFSTGDEVEIIYRGIKMGNATIAHIRTFTFSRLSEAASLLNCGRSVPYQAAMLNRYYNRGQILAPDTMLAQIIFHYTDINFKNHRQLLQQHLEEKNENS